MTSISDKAVGDQYLPSYLSISSWYSPSRCHIQIQSPSAPLKVRATSSLGFFFFFSFSGRKKCFVPPSLLFGLVLELFSFHAANYPTFVFLLSVSIVDAVTIPSDRTVPYFRCKVVCASCMILIRAPVSASKKIAKRKWLDSEKIAQPGDLVPPRTSTLLVKSSVPVAPVGGSWPSSANACLDAVWILSSWFLPWIMPR